MAVSDTSIAGMRCLVLDDEFLIALDIQQILEAAGAESVTCVSNADDALAALRDHAAFDVAVLDFKLSDPRATSLSVAAVLAERNIPFVFLTGLRDDDERLRDFAQAQILEKPYQSPLLLDAVLRALRRV